MNKEIKIGYCFTSSKSIETKFEVCYLTMDTAESQAVKEFH